MKTIASFLIAAGLGLSTAAAGSTDYIDVPVLEATPVYRDVEVSVPEEQCWQEDVVHRVNRHHGRSSTPGILGVVIGGAIGNALGHNKTNKRVGALVGAVLGGSIAKDITRKNRANDEYFYDTVEKCRTVYRHHTEQKVVGYQVLYSYNEQEYSIRMPRDPGATLQLRVNVEPVL